MMATHRPTHNRRRGIVGLTFALAMMLILFAVLATFLLALTATGLRVENAHGAAQALYAAEAGLDIALQTGRGGSFTGAVGRARYAVSVAGDSITALGEVPRAAGAPARCAVRIDVSGGRVVRGTWRQVPPGQQTDLIALLVHGS